MKTLYLNQQTVGEPWTFCQALASRQMRILKRDLYWFLHPPQFISYVDVDEQWCLASSQQLKEYESHFIRKIIWIYTNKAI